MIRPQQPASQEEFWIARQELPRVRASGFYDRLKDTLEGIGFAANVRGLCAPLYSSGTRGRPPIDPAVYFKMLMVGFLENLPSERAIAARCGDSLMIRRFLGYDLSQDTPEHSSLSVIRQRLGAEIYQGVFDLILEGLRAHGLLRGRHLGIDSSVMEANASLRALENRHTGQAYWEYVQRLAAQAGVNPEDANAVRRFDKKRAGRKTSNQEWVNRHDPDAKVAKAKDGATDMLYKPEHIVDLESGIIWQAEVRLADQADVQELTPRVVAVAELIEAINEEPAGGPEQPVQPAVGPVKTLTGDKGFFGVAVLLALQKGGIKTVISDPLANRRLDKLERSERAAVLWAKRATRSTEGKALLRRRGMHIERSFAHLLDGGGMRRATLRGQRNLDKRYKIAAATYNLSQLLRHRFGVGTPKQAAAGVGRGLFALFLAARRLLASPFTLPDRAGLFARRIATHPGFLALVLSSREYLVCSTGC